MKKLVYQYFYGKNDYPLKSSASARAYAASIGADYSFKTEGHPIRFHYGIFMPFLDDTVDKYDAVLFLDTDMLVTVGAEDIFEYMDDNIGVWHMNDGPVKPYVKNLVEEHARKVCPDWIDKGHGNTGTVLFPRAVYNEFKIYLKRLAALDQEARKGVNVVPGHTPLVYGGWDQYVVNSFNYQHGVNFLPYKFNYHLNQLPEEGRWDASFIHYHGGYKNLLRTEFNDERIMK